jgi:ABC-type nitrate/sulfonate/bicarbonate transport system permease component
MTRANTGVVGGVLLTVAALIAGWQLAIWTHDIPAYSLPTPVATLTHIGANSGTLAGSAAATLTAAAVGIAVAAALALLLALAVVRWPVLHRPVTGYALVLRTIPIVGVAPLITLVVGRGLWTSVLCVVIVATFTLFVSAAASVHAAPAALDDLAELYRAGFLRRARTMYLPSAWAGLLVGLRITVPLSVMAVILSEWLSGRPGLGSLMALSQANRETPMLWAATVVAAGLGLLSYALPDLITHFAERRGYTTAVGIQEAHR